MSESESTSDVSGTAGGETICPVCDGADTEEIVDGDSSLDYRCLACDAEFDPSGGRVNVE